MLWIIIAVEMLNSVQENKTLRITITKSLIKLTADGALIVSYEAVRGTLVCVYIYINYLAFRNIGFQFFINKNSQDGGKTASCIG